MVVFQETQGTPHLVTLHTAYDIALAPTEFPVALNAKPGIDDHLQISSTYSGGGGLDSYLAAWDSADAAATRSYIESALWQGDSGAVVGGYSNVALPGCGGATLQASGFPALGGSFTIAMSGGQGLPFLLIGTSIAPLELCSGCWLGVDPFTAVAVPTDTLTLAVPCLGKLVNQLFAFQGVDVGFATACAGAPGFSLSDEIIVTIL